MKKRRLIPVLCAAAVAVSLAGCSGGSGSATDKGADTQATKAEAHGVLSVRNALINRGGTA